MLYDYLWYAVAGLAAAAAFLAVLALNIRYERGRRRAWERMTPEERKQREVFGNALKRWWLAP
jgi:hypothetical protein